MLCIHIFVVIVLGERNLAAYDSSTTVLAVCIRSTPLTGTLGNADRL